MSNSPIQPSALTLLLLLASCLLGWAQQADTLGTDYGTPAYRLMMQRGIFPQEKCHLMTDAELYHPGDTLWFRGWVVDGATLGRSSLGSRYLYVQLCDDSLRQVVKVREAEGRFVGWLPIPRQLRPGDYTLAAHTYYMGNMADECLFRKPLHVIARTAAAAGYVPRSLYDHRPALLPLLTPEAGGVVAPVVSGGDSLTRYSFEAPAGVWLAVSVTDDQVAPVDTTLTLARMLPRVPDLFTLAQMQRAREYVQPQLQPERHAALRGQVLDGGRPQRAAEVEVFDARTCRLWHATADGEGRFALRDVDVTEGTLIVALPHDARQRLCEQVRFGGLFLPTGIAPYAGLDARPLYVDAGTPRPMTDADSVIMLDEVSVRAQAVPSREQQFVQFILSGEYDRFTANADHVYTFADLDRCDGLLFTSVAQCLQRLSGFSLQGQMAYYSPKRHGAVPVRFVVGDREEALRHDEAGAPVMPALDYPIQLLDRLEVLLPATAQRVLPSREFPDSPIVRLRFLSDRDLLTYYPYYCHYPLGTLRPHYYPNCQILPGIRRTRYWNPAVCSGPEGRITVDLPLPADVHTTYTLRAEGITSDGTPVSLMYRIVR